MASLTIDQTIARITGESLRRIRRIGFSLPVERYTDSNADELEVVLDCPFCRRPLPYPSLVSLDDPSLAECLICDVEFEFDRDEVYVLVTPMSSLPSHRRQAC
jgi:hypothetical protein